MAEQAQAAAAAKALADAQAAAAAQAGTATTGTTPTGTTTTDTTGGDATGTDTTGTTQTDTNGSQPAVPAVNSDAEKPTPLPQPVAQPAGKQGQAALPETGEQAQTGLVAIGAALIAGVLGLFGKKKADDR